MAGGRGDCPADGGICAKQIAKPDDKDCDSGQGCAGGYTEKVAEAAAANQDFVMGFICQTPAKWSTQSPPGIVALLPLNAILHKSNALGKPHLVAAVGWHSLLSPSSSMKRLTFTFPQASYT